jgi:hypothetical protein
VDCAIHSTGQDIPQVRFPMGTTTLGIDSVSVFISLGVKATGAWADNLPTFMRQLSWNSQPGNFLPTFRDSLSHPCPETLVINYCYSCVTTQKSAVRMGFFFPSLLRRLSGVKRPKLEDYYSLHGVLPQHRWQFFHLVMFQECANLYLDCHASLDGLMRNKHWENFTWTL